MKKALMLVLTLVAVSPVSTEAQLSRMTGDEQDLSELEEIGGVYFERVFFGRRTRFTGNVVQYMRHNGCWDNLVTAVLACPQMGNHFLCYRLMHRRSKKLGHSKEPR
jgi:hypothetical protein